MGKWILVGIMSLFGLLLVAGIAFTATVLAFGPARWDWEDGQNWNWHYGDVSTTESIQKTFRVTGTADLSVENWLGSVTVRQGNAGEVAMEATIHSWGKNRDEAEQYAKQVKIDQTQDGDHISIKPSYPKEDSIFGITTRSESVDLVVTVPKDTKADVRANVGQVKVDGVQGDVRVVAKLGAVEITNITGSLDVQADLGKVNIHNARLTGDLNLEAKAGQIVFQGTLARGHRHNVTAEMGSVHLILPAESAFDLDAKADFGDVSNEFAITGGSEKKVVGESLTGTVGSPAGTTLTMQANMGSVSIEKQ